MYKCNVCDKTYKTRTTLTRHAHNHTDGLTHTCDTCGVSFARRDILNRHLRQGHVDEAAKPRQRTHTACEPCRTARTKCDGGEPCHNCTDSQKTCSYSTASRRISKAAHRRAQQPSTNSDELLLMSPPLAESDANYNMGLDIDDGLQFEPSTFGLDPQEVDTALQAPVGIFSQTDDVENNGFNISELGNLPVDLDGMSWPWLHETLFLQNDPFAGLFDDTALQQDQSHISGLDGNANGTGSATARGEGLMPSPSADDHPVVSADPNNALAQQVDELVEYTAKSSSEPVTWTARISYWQAASSRLEAIFLANPLHTAQHSDEKHLMHHVILSDYMPKFNRLWQMFSRCNFDPDALSPVLYLVLVSIGSMYGSVLQKHFGTLLHTRLRRLLAGSSFDLENPEGDMIWLAHARLLTQVQGLYFGQKQGFSYAQHLGALLIAQSRRLNLFREPSYNLSESSDLPEAEEAQLSRWRSLESRKRLAYGIMRADVYTSVLLNSRPLLSYEEIYLSLPHSEKLYHNDGGLSWREQLLTSRIEAERCPQMVFSDLLRVMLERNETASLDDAVAFELCLFAMQSALWRFSHDVELFPRLTGTEWESASPPGLSDRRTLSSLPEPTSTDLLSGRACTAPDRLGRVHRNMRDMRDDRDRMERALESWHNGFLVARQSPAFTKHRDSLMSSLLLFNTSHLQLHAPLAQLHNVSYRAGETRPVSSKTVQQIYDWSMTRNATHAIERAVAICDLISQELDRPEHSRACFNFLAFGSLHHATVVLWTMSEIGSGSDDGSSERSRSFSRFMSKLEDGDTHGLLKECSALFNNLSSLGGASFGTAAEQLSATRFPKRPESDKQGVRQSRTAP